MKTYLLSLFTVILLITAIESVSAHEFDSLGLLVRHKENQVSLISAPALAALATDANGEKLNFDLNSDGNISFDEIREFEEEIAKRVEQLVVFYDEQGREAKLHSFKLLEKGYENVLKIAVADDSKRVDKNQATDSTQARKDNQQDVYIQLSLKYKWQSAPQTIRLNYGLLADEQKHVLIRNQNTSESQVLVLEPESSTITVFPINSDNNANTKPIWLLGIEHVLAGLDHILFILTLVLVCKSLRDLIVPLSAFTLTHSLALALVALGVEITIPSRLIEVGIAMTIVIMALYELFGGQLKRLFLVTGAMGIIHGFGLGQALTDSIGGIEGWAIALVQVTIGVELAQLAIALCFVAMLHRMSKLKEKSQQKIASSISSVVVCVGLFWTVERLMI
ncbi:HupE/UreJ family protein [Colwelliaceae bacterium 6471]